MPEGTKKRRCRICGCTDDDCRQCIEKTGEPCYWVEADLCSACAEELAAEVGGILMSGNDFLRGPIEKLEKAIDYIQYLRLANEDHEEYRDRAIHCISEVIAELTSVENRTR